MPFLKRIISPFLCCFGVPQREDQAISDLQTLPSALHLPASQIPHAVNRPGSNPTDTDALRELFRTSSSIRGYRTASIPSGSLLHRESSFDADFRFGPQEQPQKPASRLGQLGNHIKQKLSESGLNKTGSKPHVASENDEFPTVKIGVADLGTNLPEVSVSQRSTGLLNILQSRTASDGGYDSDAKSIRTAMLMSREGTMKLSPDRARTLLSSSADLGHFAAEDGAPPSLDARQVADGVENVQSTRSTSPFADARLPLARAAQEKLDEPPEALLLGLDAQDSENAIQTPPRSPSKPVHPFAALEYEGDDPFTAKPALVNTASSGGPEPGAKFVDALKKFGDGIPAATRESLISNVTDPRTSLVSNLDPSVLDFISRCSDPASMDMPPTQPLSREENSRLDLTSVAESERASVHLYSMRISQRLASPSFVAVSSRPNTSHTVQLERENSSKDQFPFSRSSTSGNLAGRITTEHNRRPSDPRTRRLFEGSNAISKPPSVWRDGAPSEPSTNQKVPKQLMSTDDASSFYWSDGEFGDSEQSNYRPVKRNPNSIAVGGRTESISLPVGSSSRTPSMAEESICFGRKSLQHNRELESESTLPLSTARNRSVSMPGEHTHDSLPHLTLSRTQAQNPTEADESMSVIGLGLERMQRSREKQLTSTSIQARKDARDEKLTELSAEAIQDVRNERMSEVGPVDRNLDTQAGSSFVNFWADHGPSTLSPGVAVVGRRSASQSTNPTASDLTSKPRLLESTTEVWQKSFQRAFEEPLNDSLGGFLSLPKFDCEGRRRSSKSSISAVLGPPEHAGSEIGLGPLDTTVLHIPPQAKEKPLLEVCMKKPEPLPSVHPRRSIVITEPRKEGFNTCGPKSLRKKSLLDIGRRFSALGTSPEPDRDPDSRTPLKELLGSWARFPSHAREQRCESAGAKDGIAVRDFALECQDENKPSCSANHVRPNTALELQTPGSWKFLSFGRKSGLARRQSKSASPLHGVRTPLSIARRSKNNRKRMTGRLQKLYRTSSMDFQAYTHNYGHRSSVSVGGSVEYPELEVIPGSPGWRSELDGAAEREHQHRREGAARSQLKLETPLDTAPWTQAYRNCVGSLSALKSDPELSSLSLEGGPESDYHQTMTLGGMSSADLRESTVNFESQLGKENEAAKESLMRKVESMQPIQG